MKNYLLLFLLLGVYSMFPQWAQRAGLGSGNNRTFATSFSVNGKIYVIGGNENFTGLADVFAYDPVADSWTAKSPFPGGIRGGAIAFSIGGYGYFGCGANYVGQFFKDLWKYDPVTDTWVQQSDAPFFQREEAICFVIGNFAYVGTGYLEITGPNSTTSATLNDFWQYDPTTDTWTVKAMVPGSPRGWAIGAAANGLGYAGMGGGPDQTVSYNDFYEYDPQQNTWTARASYPQSIADASVFDLGGEVYVCGGINFPSYSGSSAFRKYLPASNTWSSMPAFPAGAIIAATANTVSGRVFLGTGYTSSFAERQDWWEFVITGTTTCPAPVSFSLNPQAAANGTCSSKIVISGVTNGCSPYSVTVSPATGSIQMGVGSATVHNVCAGNYTIIVADNNCCGASQRTCTVPQNSGTGLSEELVTQHPLQVLPNPNAGHFILHNTNFSGQSETAIRISDISGRTIPFEWIRKNGWLEISITDTAKGLYFITCEQSTGPLTQKFVVE